MPIVHEPAERAKNVLHIKIINGRYQRARQKLLPFQKTDFDLCRQIPFIRKLLGL